MPDPVVHFEIISSEAPNLHRFYGSVFGWKIAADNPFGYGLVDTRNPGRGINGGIGTPMQGGSGHFTVYVQVPNIDAALSRVVTEGGRIALSKTTVPNGPTMAQFFDPAGHLMGLIEGAAQSDAAQRARIAASLPPRPKAPVRAPTSAPAVPKVSAVKAAPAVPVPKVAEAKPKLTAKPKTKPRVKPKAKPTVKAKVKAAAKKTKSATGSSKPAAKSVKKVRSKGSRR
jgi:predicted enzyme related to lactoylglutathione lyase